MAVEFNKANLAFGAEQFAAHVDIDFNLFSLNGKDNNHGCRYVKPAYTPFLKANIRYQYAKDLAADIDVQKGERINVLMSGNFVFGEFINAFIGRYRVPASECWISTLSMSEQNVKQLKALMEHNYIGDLHLFLSTYFYSHEQWKMMPIIMNTLDVDNRFQCSISDMHVKVVLLKMDDGRFIVMHGSANLRSSACIEQVCIEESEQLYNFYRETFQKIESTYYTINKAIRSDTAWVGMEKKVENESDDPFPTPVIL